MNSLFALRALLFAGECFAASAVLLSLAWLATKFLKDASQRHIVWLTVFGTLLVLPVVALIVPPQIAIHQTTHAVMHPVPPYIEPASMADIASVSMPAAMPAPASTSTSTVVAKPSWKWPSIDESDIAIALFLAWFAGFLWASSRLIIGASGLAMLRRTSRPHVLSPADLPRLASNGRECELRLSSAQDGPMTWGLIKPVVLLPKNSVTWSRERLQAVLLHELAHVRRRDSLSQTLSLIVCAFYWPNPLIWIGARAMRRDAEIAADDAVIVSGMKPSAYAGELLQLASEFRGHGLAVSGVSMAGQSSLEARVKSVLAPDQSRTGVRSMDILKVACLGLVATAALAFVRPDIVAAQDTTVMPAPAAAPTVPDAPDAVPTPPSVDTVSMVPDAPPAPPAPPAPRHVRAVPPAPHVAPVPPVAMVDAEEDNDADDADDAGDADDANVNVDASRHGDKVVKVRVWHDKDGRRHVERSVRLTPADRAEIAHARDEARRAVVEVQRMQPEIDKAVAAAKIDEKVARAMREVEPRVRAEIARAMAEAKPEIRRAIAEAHISEKVMKALHDAQPKIDAAMRRANEAQRRIEIEQVERNGDDEAPSAEDNGDDDSAGH